MKREGDDFLDMDGLSERDSVRPSFSFINVARTALRSMRLTSLVGLIPDNENPLQSATQPSNSTVTNLAKGSSKKRITSGEFHMNYLGYEANDVLSSGSVVSDSSKIRLDQDRPSDVVVDPFRSTFPGQRGYMTESRTI